MLTVPETAQRMIERDSAATSNGHAWKRGAPCSDNGMAPEIYIVTLDAANRSGDRSRGRMMGIEDM